MSAARQRSRARTSAPLAAPEADASIEGASRGLPPGDLRGIRVAFRLPLPIDSALDLLIEGREPPAGAGIDGGHPTYVDAAVRPYRRSPQGG